jgi:hypothetical protein
VNKAYLNYVMEPVNANWDLQLSIATLWALITPSGWLKWVWDPVMQRPDMIPVPFFDLAVDPYAKQFAARAVRDPLDVHGPDQVSEAFGVTVDKDEIGVQDSLKVELLRGMGAAPVTKGVQVHELWMRPSKKNPEGLYALFTNKRILKMERRLPYKHLREGLGMLPFTQLGSLLRPDSLYYTSPVTALRPGADGLEQVRRPGHHDPGELRRSEVVDCGRATDAEPCRTARRGRSSAATRATPASSRS